MNPRTRPVVCAAVCLALLAGVSRAAVSAESLREWLTYLSSDDLEGRETFSEGLGLAAAYIAGKLESFGVKPAGDHGTYFQRVSVLGVKATNHSSVTVEVNGQRRTFKQGEGVTFPADSGGKRTVIADEVLFAGYGLDLDDEHNDYKGLKAKGKAVVYLGRQGPEGVDARASGQQLRNRGSFAIREMGALAALSQPSEARGRGGNTPPPADAPATGRGARRVQPDFTTASRLDREVAPNLTASDEFFEFLFSASKKKYSELKDRAERREDLDPFTLKGVRLTFETDVDYEIVNTRYTRNVVGTIEGSDPVFKSEYVAFGAHYDHTGYSQGALRDGQTDRIYNGADDDGSGSSVLLGLAQAYARGPRTKRSLLFVWHAGEEEGLYGSAYFADHPFAPLDKVAAQLNMDMLGRNKDDSDKEENTLYPVGADRVSSQLHNLLIDTNGSLSKPLKLDFSYNDPTDAERIYFRSDHYSYAAQGVPIIFFTTGLHPDYHKVTDSVEKIHFDKMARIAELVEETGRRVANLDHMPIRDNKGARVGKGGGGKVK